MVQELSIEAILAMSPIDLALFVAQELYGPHDRDIRSLYSFLDLQDNGDSEATTSEHPHLNGDVEYPTRKSPRIAKQAQLKALGQPNVGPIHRLPRKSA